MHKIDTPNANNNKFIDQDTANGIVGTSASAAWLNSVQDEIISVLIKANIVPNKATDNQLADAIKLIAKDQLGSVDTSFYALKNGDATKKFKVADATNNNEAVNKGQVNGIAISFGSIQVSGYVNNYDGIMDWTAPSGSVIVGVYSVHSNQAEDRRFKYKYRSISISNI
ncbi:hypothetical protein [Bathymodiolus septemdierum thioautotrophic gill symbiont]|uniref:Tail fiber protein n=1 Tax=endosymbiont of Bathymodiolus septemdierum str. Myojin knoll TaxID=1303921 RepID=A0A0P0URI7_9GAMM|nr:hypothetical protein [Bathymodiolus septemdierum thioautotrophic gill symbiont]BAS67629.1 hypothetical protein BSEPE_0625 [endosymbiont of Bathymodiolus septemdierum str. Myojin knoll]